MIVTAAFEKRPLSVGSILIMLGRGVNCRRASVWQALIRSLRRSGRLHTVDKLHSHVMYQRPTSAVVPFFFSDFLTPLRRLGSICQFAPRL